MQLLAASVQSVRNCVAAFHARSAHTVLFSGDGRCPICDSFVRPHAQVRVCDECNYGSFANRCCVCGLAGVADAYYCKECVQQEKDVSEETANVCPDFVITARASAARRLPIRNQHRPSPLRLVLRQKEVRLPGKVTAADRRAGEPSTCESPTVAASVVSSGLATQGWQLPPVRCAGAQRAARELRKTSSAFHLPVLSPVLHASHMFR